MCAIVLSRVPSLLSLSGTLAPELEVLRVEGAGGVPRNAAFFEEFYPDAMVQLPRLKEFSLGRIVESFVHGRSPSYASTETVNRLISWLLASVPIVETFCLGHGRSSMTRKNEKEYSYPPLPGIGDIVWPTSLKHLVLTDLELEPSVFNNTDFPSLKTIKLKRCGSSMTHIIEGLARTHPSVQASQS